MAKHDGFWRGIDRLLPVSAVSCAALWVVWIFRPERQLWLPIATQLNIVVEIVYAWACITLLLGLAQRHLSFDRPVLRYLTGAVFCYYILRQTIIVAVGHWLTPLSLGPWPEFVLVFGATVTGCLAGYEVIKRIPYVRGVFGIQ